MARTADAWLTMGVGPTLDDATFAALQSMLDLLVRQYDVSRPDAVALASVALDIRVTQIVNQTVDVHRLRDDAIG